MNNKIHRIRVVNYQQKKKKCFSIFTQIYSSCRFLFFWVLWEKNYQAHNANDFPLSDPSSWNQLIQQQGERDSE